MFQMSNKHATKREPLSIAIKDSIRLYYKENQNLNINDMVSWAEHKYGLPFLPATMRTIIFPKPKKSPLWSTPTTHASNRQRERAPNWPELEIELAKWYTSQSSPPKGQDLKEKANELWRELAPKHYIEQKQPSFGDSWRDKFKERHGFKYKKSPIENYLCPPDISNGADQMFDKSMDVDGEVAGNFRAQPNSDYAAYCTPVPSSLTTTQTWQTNRFCNETAHPNNLCSPLGSQQTIFSSQSTPRHDSLSPFSSFPGHLSQSPKPYGIDNHGVFMDVPNSEISVMMTSKDTGQSSSTSSIYTYISTSQPFDPDCLSALGPHGRPTSKTGNLEESNSRQNCGINGNRDIVSNRPYLPNAMGRRGNRYRAHTSNSVNIHAPALASDAQLRKRMGECISNLFSKATHSGQNISSSYVQYIIDTLASAIGKPKSPDTLETSRGAISRYDSAAFYQINSTRRASIKALRLLQLAESFKIQAPAQKEWSDWESEVSFNMFVRLPSSDLDSDDCNEPISGRAEDVTCDIVRRRAISPRIGPSSSKASRHCEATFFSMASKFGRVDIRTATYSTTRLSNVLDYTAEVVLTLPARRNGPAQIRFLLSQQVTPELNTTLTPMLSARQMIPDDSEVFQTAATGTVKALRDLLCARKASLSDCDSKGRSLINYALANYNVEMCCYLLQFVNDVDFYEMNDFGVLCPLAGMLFANCAYLPADKCEQRTQCFKNLLQKGADPTLQMPTAGGRYCNIFETELAHGPKDTVEALMNSEYPTISFNSLGDEGKEGLSPLCYLADSFRTGIIPTFQASEKFKFLLKNGADVQFYDDNGNTCLHLILTYDKVSALQLIGSAVYNEAEFQSILMAMITAGADVEAYNWFGQTASDIACLYDHEELWIQVLAACGYNPWEVFSLDNEWLRRYAGINIFSAMKISKFPFEDRHTHQESIELDDTPIDHEDWSMSKTLGEIKAIYGDNDDDTDDGYSIDIYGYCDTPIWNGIEDDIYRPINGDPTWLAYVPQYQYLRYWMNTGSLTSSESDYCESSDGEDPELWDIDIYGVEDDDD